jgi:hypothetical protein
MTDHPSTFRGGTTGSDDIDWDDRAEVRRKDDSGGVLHGMKGLHRGTLAEMVTLVRNMPEGDRANYVIHKAGDRRFEVGEIMALASRPDFPG